MTTSALTEAPPTATEGGRPRRVLLKLSGEVFGGGSVGVDPDVVRDVARQIAAAVRDGIEVAVVVGGGNFFRGAELQQKGQTAGAGAGLAIAAMLFALYALGFGLAAVAAAIALVVDWWLALLIVFLALVLLVFVLGAVSRALVRKTGSLRPEQAMEEARRTKDVLRGLGAG